MPLHTAVKELSQIQEEVHAALDGTGFDATVKLYEGKRKENGAPACCPEPVANELPNLDLSPAAVVMALATASGSALPKDTSQVCH